MLQSLQILELSFLAVVCGCDNSSSMARLFSSFTTATTTSRAMGSAAKHSSHRDTGIMKTESSLRYSITSTFVSIWRSHLSFHKRGRQRGRVDKAVDLTSGGRDSSAALTTKLQLFHGRPLFNSSFMLVNSQLVCPL